MYILGVRHAMGGPNLGPSEFSPNSHWGLDSC
nr:MAG TPA: protein of unknown function (DUF4071) [Caudoviricetes sp.]